MELNVIKHYRTEAGAYIGASNVPIDGGIECPPPADARQIWDEIAEAWGEIEPDPPIVMPPRMVSCALRVSVADDEVSAIGGSFNIMTMMRIDVGTFWVFCLNEITGPQPELVPNNGISITLSEWSGTDFFIECRDHAGGTLIDPASFGFTLYQF